MSYQLLFSGFFDELQRANSLLKPKLTYLIDSLVQPNTTLGIDDFLIKLPSLARSANFFHFFLSFCRILTHSG